MRKWDLRISSHSNLSLKMDLNFTPDCKRNVSAGCVT